MGRQSQSSFLTALDKHFSKVRSGGSLFITFKRCLLPPGTQALHIVLTAALCKMLRGQGN
jgi:hypothetical protein